MKRVVKLRVVPCTGRADDPDATPLDEAALVQKRNEFMSARGREARCFCETKNIRSCCRFKMIEFMDKALAPMAPLAYRHLTYNKGRNDYVLRALGLDVVDISGAIKIDKTTLERCVVFAHTLIPVGAPNTDGTDMRNVEIEAQL